MIKSQVLWSDSDSDSRKYLHLSSTWQGTQRAHKTMTQKTRRTHSVRNSEPALAVCDHIRPPIFCGAANLRYVDFYFGLS